MKRTVEIDFLDDFKFPKHYDGWGRCTECPLCISEGLYGYCFLTGDGDNGEITADCPFFEKECFEFNISKRE